MTTLNLVLEEHDKGKDEFQIDDERYDLYRILRFNTRLSPWNLWNNTILLEEEVIDAFRVYDVSVRELANGIGKDQFEPLEYGEEMDVLIKQANKAMRHITTAIPDKYPSKEQDLMSKRAHKILSGTKERYSRRVIDDEGIDILPTIMNGFDEVFNPLLKGSVQKSLDTYINRSVGYVEGTGFTKSEDIIRSIALIEYGFSRIIDNVPDKMLDSKGRNKVYYAHKEFLDTLNEKDYPKDVKDYIKDQVGFLKHGTAYSRINLNGEDYVILDYNKMSN